MDFNNKENNNENNIESNNENNIESNNENNIESNIENNIESNNVSLIENSDENNIGSSNESNYYSQNPNGYGTGSQYDPQIVYSDTGGASFAEKAAAKKAFKLALIKLAVIAMIVMLNNKLLYYIFYFPAVMILRAVGQNASTELIYVVSWITNDLSAYLIPSIAAFLLFRKELREKLPYPPHPNASTVLNSGLTFFAACFLGSLAGLFADFVATLLDSFFGTGEIPDAMEGTIPSQGETGSFWVMFFFVAVVAPVFEELIFRKLLLHPLRKHGDWFAIIMTALMFGFYHGNFDQMPYAVVVGILFALLAVNTNSVIPSMILHLLNNASVTLSQYLVKVTGEVEPALSLSNWISEGLALSFWIGIPAVALMIAGKLFKTTQIPVLPPKTKAGLLFKSPAFYIFIIFTALLMVPLKIIG